MDFGRRADGRARVADAVLLPNRNRRADALDDVDVRLLHPLEKLPRIGRQRLDIAPLALGVDRVEGERRLARPADPGHDDQGPLRDGQVDVLEVVRAGPADDDVVPSLTSGWHLQCALLGKPEQSIVAHTSQGFNLERLRPRRPGLPTDHQPASNTPAGSRISISGRGAGSMLFCWSQGGPRQGRMFRFAGLYPGPNTRELCQSVCSSATCLIPRPSRIYASICRASEPQRKSCSPPIGRPDDREASRSSTTPIARSPRRRSGASTSNRSRGGRWR